MHMYFKSPLNIDVCFRSISGDGAFRVPFGLQMVTATLLGVGIHFFPYSPRWLALVHRDQDCLKSLSTLRRLPTTDSRIQTEWKSILAEVEFQKEIVQHEHPGATGVKLEILAWLDLFGKKTWKRTAVACGICFFTQVSQPPSSFINHLSF